MRKNTMPNWSGTLIGDDCTIFAHKALEKRGNMLPETFATDTCFPNVFQFCYKGENTVSSSKLYFCFGAETKFAAGNSVSYVAKTGKHRGNMCPQQMFLATCFLVLAGLKAQ